MFESVIFIRYVRVVSLRNAFKSDCTCITTRWSISLTNEYASGKAECSAERSMHYISSSAILSSHKSPTIQQGTIHPTGSLRTSSNMMQIKYLFALFAVLMVVVLGANEVDADCLSGRYKGPCAVWDNETCRRVCKEEGRVSGHCSPSLKCWCEGC